MRIHLRFALAATAALLLAACGGGGSDSPTPAPVQPTVAISAGNQEAVAATAANAVISVGSFAAATPLATGERVVAAGKTGGSAAFAVRAGSLGAAIRRLALDAALAPISVDTSVKFESVVRALGTVTTNPPCPGGGSLTIMLNDADNSGGASPGDSASITFNQCRPAPDELVTGTVTVVYVSLTATPTRTVVGATVSYSNIAATSPDGSFSLNGSLSLSAAREGTLDTATLVVGASGLTASVTAVLPVYTDTLTFGAGLTIVATADSAAVPPGGGAAGLSTARLDGAISSTRLGGTIVIATVTPVQQYDIDPFPRAGQLVATGAGGSRLRLTAVSTTTLRIELDANGDGTYESLVERPWGDVL